MNCSKVCPFLVVLLLLFSGIYFYTQFQNIQMPDKEPTPSVEAPTNIPDLITVASPLSEEVIASPLHVTGTARGYWFFEATAPVVITDWDGLIIGEGYVTATEPWMTEEFVPFEGMIEFTKPKYKNTGAIIFKNANASGLPEHDQALEFPVLFE